MGRVCPGDENLTDKLRLPNGTRTDMGGIHHGHIHQGMLHFCAIDLYHQMLVLPAQAAAVALIQPAKMSGSQAGHRAFDEIGDDIVGAGGNGDQGSISRCLATRGRCRRRPDDVAVCTA